ncbi:hypothetical protein QBC39DRAFT_363373 [Podospora conica]|nr:hypothetical protein QBC39DRAFT_363373 [Schizothecium conicum]
MCVPSPVCGRPSVWLASLPTGRSRRKKEKRQKVRWFLLFLFFSRLAASPCSAVSWMDSNVLLLTAVYRIVSYRGDIQGRGVVLHTEKEIRKYTRSESDEARYPNCRGELLR